MIRRLIGRLRQQREHDLRKRVATDAENVRLFMVAVTTDARRVGVKVPIEVLACIVVWAGWARRLQEWAEVSEEE